MSDHHYGRDPRGCMHLDAGRKRALVAAIVGYDPTHMEIIRPVVRTEEGRVNIDYMTGGGPAGIIGEDWSLPLKAQQTPHGYEVFREFAKVASVGTRTEAISELAKRIDEKGRLKPEREDTTNP